MPDGDNDQLPSADRASDDSAHKKVRKRPSFDNPPVDEDEDLLTKRAELSVRWATAKYCLEQLAQRGRLPRGVGAEARRELKIGSRQGLNKFLKGVQKYHRDHPDEPPENAVVRLKAGRPRTEILNDLEEAFFITACMKTDWPIEAPDGEVKQPKNVVPPLAFIRNLLIGEYPHHKNVTLRQLQTILGRHRAGDDLLSFILSWNGARAVKEHLAHKVDNDADAPDERWISDARYLPILIRMGQIVCSVVLVVIMDDYSRYVLHWFILPRKIEVAPDDIHSVDFTNKHLRGHLASIMDKTERRALNFYTDNGSQYKALIPYMMFIARDNQTTLNLIRSTPDEPWGRGKVEVLLKLIDAALKEWDGYVKSSRSLKSRSTRRTAREFRLAWNAAHKEPGKLLSFEQLRMILEKYFKAWNDDANDNEPSRRALWEGVVVPSVALPAPRDIDLAQFAFAAKTDKASITDAGIRKKFPSSIAQHATGQKNLWEPPEWTVEARRRWMKAVGKGTKVPICFIAPIEGHHIVIACVDGVNWERIVPKGTNRISADAQPRLTNRAIEAEDDDLKGKIKHLEDQLREKYGDIPRKVPISHEVKYPDAPKTDGPAAPTTADADMETQAAVGESAAPPPGIEQASTRRMSRTSAVTPETTSGSATRHQRTSASPRKAPLQSESTTAPGEPADSVLPSEPDVATAIEPSRPNSIDRMRQLRAQRANRDKPGDDRGK
ncbi:MAG: hypothetical protein M3R24_31655 [Chloroflexota bacterium]|nr:hypothetical protein [Chloroflexota bacterium]